MRVCVRVCVRATPTAWTRSIWFRTFWLPSEVNIRFCGPETLDARCQVFEYAQRTEKLLQNSAVFVVVVVVVVAVFITNIVETKRLHLTLGGNFV